ncbi:DMT family transporter [Nereida sp. MMG025]|uniref:DMT family transporter n=1 Tax=Nereida sp. MMG025 TaxID=2909981 RepID=UPI001F44D33A|nr:DMT family transporter [Nereida sp. MMG025]MCF6443463.1 DMT family transporter [Nereida sp. MMG025]
MNDNLRGAILMVSAMLGFAIEDAFIKTLAGAMPVGQILMIFGFGGAVLFGIMVQLQGQSLWSRAILHPGVILRNLGELIGTVGFVTAIILTPLSTASAILQATPLVVTLGAAVFLQEQVGWRRWAAILVGFFGVLLIIRPGAADFEPNSFFAVQGVVGLAIRDLATRRVPKDITSMQLSTFAFAMLVPAGGILMLFWGEAVMPTQSQWLTLGAALIVGVIAYYMIVAAMRVGEVAFVTPFRYSRLLFALIIGIAVFGERPDWLTLLGAAIIVGSGLFTLLREAALKRASHRAPPLV